MVTFLEVQLARKVAADHGGVAEVFGEKPSLEELIGFLWEHALDDGESVRSMSWMCGSYAGIIRYRGCFFGYDDASHYGPFETYKEACASGSQFWGYDEVLQDWTHPDHEEATQCDSGG